MTRRSCPAGSNRVSDAAGACVCAPGAIDAAGACAPAALFFGAFAAAIAALLALACLVARHFGRRAAGGGDVEDAAFQARVDALRERLALTVEEGFILSTDRVSLLRRTAAATAAALRLPQCCVGVGGGGGSNSSSGKQEAVHVQRSHLEAGVRLWLLRDDADVKLVNALCATVMGRQPQLRRVCDWLLEVARLLLDPAPLRCDDRLASDSGSWMAASPALAVDLSRMSTSTGNPTRRLLRKVASVGAVEEEQRRSLFNYFLEKVVKVLLAPPV